MEEDLNKTVLFNKSYVVSVTPASGWKQIFSKTILDG